MMKWSLEDIHLPLKFNWKIARNETLFKTNLLVRLKVDELEGLGEVAFNIRYGEDSEKLKHEFEHFSHDFPQDIESVEEVMEFCAQKELSSSLRFGIESAFVHYLAVASGKSVHELLGMPSVTSLKTSFSLPIMPIEELDSFIKKHGLDRFQSLKLKVNQENAIESFNQLAKIYHGKIRVDANESWSDPDQVLHFLEKIKKLDNLEFLEQPLKADLHDESLDLKKYSPVMIFADESLTTQNITEYYSDRFHGVNIKLMKSGSYLKAIRQLREARKLGLKTMIGCMIETTLGISSAMNIAYGADYLDLDGCLLIEKDPFNFILEEKGRLFRADLH